MSLKSAYRNKPDIPAVEPDAATALQGQIAALKQAEQLQRQEPRQPSPEEARRQLAQYAYDHSTALGFAPNTPEHQASWNRIMGALTGSQQQAAPQPTAVPRRMELPVIDDDTRTPEQNRASIVSAPVSREVPGGSYEKRYNGSSITLSPEQREFCRNNGLSEVENARNVQRLEAEKARGERQNR